MTDQEARVVIRDIAKISKDILGIKISLNDSFDDIFIKFQEILTKHGIERTFPIYNELGEEIARQGSCYEFTMALTLFRKVVSDFIQWQQLKLWI